MFDFVPQIKIVKIADLQIFTIFICGTESIKLRGPQFKYDYFGRSRPENG